MGSGHDCHAGGSSRAHSYSGFPLLKQLRLVCPAKGLRSRQGLLTTRGRIDMKTLLRALHQEESGQDLVEYALVVALIALAAVAALQGVATAITNALNKISTAIAAAVS